MVLTVVIAVTDMVDRRTRAVLAPLAVLIVAAWLPIQSHGMGYNRVCLNRAHPRPHGFSTEPPFGDLTEYLERYAPYRGQVLAVHSELAVRLGDPVLFDWLTLKLLFETGGLDFEILQCAVEQGRYPVLVFDRTIDDDYITRLHDAARRRGYRRTYFDERMEEFVLPAAR